MQSWACPGRGVLSERPVQSDFLFRREAPTPNEPSPDLPRRSLLRHGKKRSSTKTASLRAPPPRYREPLPNPGTEPFSPPWRSCRSAPRYVAPEAEPMPPRKGPKPKSKIVLCGSSFLGLECYSRTFKRSSTLSCNAFSVNRTTHPEFR